MRLLRFLFFSERNRGLLGSVLPVSDTSILDAFENIGNFVWGLDVYIPAVSIYARILMSSSAGVMYDEHPNQQQPHNQLSPTIPPVGAQHYHQNIDPAMLSTNNTTGADPHLHKLRSGDMIAAAANVTPLGKRRGRPLEIDVPLDTTAYGPFTTTARATAGCSLMTHGGGMGSPLL
eukprot:GSA25T00012223001.1